MKNNLKLSRSTIVFIKLIVILSFLGVLYSIALSKFSASTETILCGIVAIGSYSIFLTKKNKSKQ